MSMPDVPSDAFDQIAAAAASGGSSAMFAALATSLIERRRWHALFDLRLLEARSSLGLSLSGDRETVDAGVRESLDARSLEACREVGWPLLDEGQVAAAWMYLRAAAAPAEVAARLSAIADDLGESIDPADEASEQRLQEIIHVALWEGVDSALGIRLVIARQGTCNAITAYEQAVSRLPVGRQQPAAAVLVSHLHREIAAALESDLGGRGIQFPVASGGSIVELLDAVGGKSADAGLHVDVSHLQSVLRIARVCIDPVVLRQAWELAIYGCRLPAGVSYPGEPPFEDVANASRLFFGAQLGRDVDAAVAHFRRAAAIAAVEEAGTLPADTLTYLLWRLGRPAEALHAALARPADHGMPSTMQSCGMLPPLVELAVAGDVVELLLDACRKRGDEITFAAALAAADQRRDPERL